MKQRTKNPMTTRTRLTQDSPGSLLSRRTFLGALSVAAVTPLTPLAAHAQRSAPSALPGGSQLPLRTTGLEHIGAVVPDVAAAGKFYARLFNPELHKEKAPPLRYYATLNPGYIALGSRANAPRAFFDHFCALVEDYDAAAMTQELAAAGLPTGRFGIIPDPDGIGLQLLGVPGGLAKTTEPAGRIVADAPLVRPAGLEEVLLYVSDLERSLAFYRRFFGPEAGHESQHAWFKIRRTRLRLQAAPQGEPPRIDRIRVRVAPLQFDAVSRELSQLGAAIAASEDGVLHLRDPVGLGIELRPI